MAQPARPYPGTQSVARAIAVLKAFTDARPHMTLAEISRAASLNKATAYRLLTALQSEGLITRHEASEAYRLGPEAIALGWRAMRSNDLHSAGRPELEALAHATRETATLEVLTGGEVLIVDEVHGNHVLGNVQSTGTRWPAHATSTGKVLLAYMPDAASEAVAHRPLTRLTPRTLTTSASLHRELARVRRQGFATAVEELELGLVAVGAPVRNHSGEVIAAVSVSGPTHRLTGSRLPDIAARVRAAADRVSTRLGFKK